MSWFIGKDPDSRKDWAQQMGATEDELVGYHHWVSECEFVRKDPECGWIGWLGDKWESTDRLRLREVQCVAQCHVARRQPAEFNPHFLPLELPFRELKSPSQSWAYFAAPHLMSWPSVSSPSLTLSGAAASLASPVTYGAGQTSGWPILGYGCAISGQWAVRLGPLQTKVLGLWDFKSAREVSPVQSDHRAP